MFVDDRGSTWARRSESKHPINKDLDFSKDEHAPLATSHWEKAMMVSKGDELCKDMNDMIQSIIQTAVSGGSTMDLVQKYLNSQNPNDPKVAQARRMIFGKSAGELEQTGRNLLQEAGTTPEEILSGLGIHF